MQLRTTILALSALFIAFVLEHLPLPDLLSWLQPPWLLLVLTVLVMHAPHVFGLWLAIPLGLMLDVEQHQLLGLHVLTLGIHIVVLQFLYRRLLNFHFLQLTVVVTSLVALQQILTYWAIALVADNVTPVQVWQPALVSALVWPWLYALMFIAMKRLNLS